MSSLIFDDSSSQILVLNGNTSFATATSARSELLSTADTGLANPTTSKTETPATDTVELDSEEWFWGNSENFTFTTQVRVSKANAQLCLDVSMKPGGGCPYPYMRARISGDAMTNVPMTMQRGMTASTSSSIVSSGCALLPIPGKFFLDMNLLHCTMDPAEMGKPGLNLQSKRPLNVWKRNVKNFTFTIQPFVRDESVYTVPPEDRKNVFPYHAWIYAPRCGESLTEIGPDCTAVAATAPMARTAFQDASHLPVYNEIAVEVFDDYVWLPVDLKKGEVDYKSLYSVPLYAPPLPGVNASINSNVICFLGDSHARYLSYLSKMIFYNDTLGKDGCVNRKIHTGWVGPDITHQFRYIKMELSHKFLAQANLTVHFEPCDMIVTLFGHWHAGTGRRPTAPADFANGAMRVMTFLENITRNSTRIYMLSPEANPISWRLVACVDWRTLPMMDAYNACLRNRTVATTATIGEEQVVERKFVGLKNAFYLDNTDIMDPIWDEARDWNHPCRFAFRTMAYRILLLMSRRITP